MVLIRKFWKDDPKRRYLALVELNNDDEILMVQVSKEELDYLCLKYEGGEIKK